MSSITTRITAHVAQSEVYPYTAINSAWGATSRREGCREIYEENFGWGKKFLLPFEADPRCICWFHLPVPTIQWLNHETLYLDSLFFYFNSDTSAAIHEIHLWDGSARVWEQPLSVGMNGNWKNPRTITASDGSSITNDLRPRWLRGSAIGHRIQFHTGLCISLKTIFTRKDANITFHSVGAGWINAAV